jgi:hypothetical protein
MRRYLIDYARTEPSVQFLPIEGLPEAVLGSRTPSQLAVAMNALLDQEAAHSVFPPQNVHELTSEFAIVSACSAGCNCRAGPAGIAALSRGWTLRADRCGYFLAIVLVDVSIAYTSFATKLCRTFWI